MINKSASDPDWINLRTLTQEPNWHELCGFANNYSEVLAAACTNNGALSDVNGTAFPAPSTLEFHLIFMFLAAAGVPVSSGLLSDISGNSLPNSPETTVGLGIQYTGL